MQFSIIRFRRYARDLSTAIQDLAEEAMIERLEQKMALAAGVAQRATAKIEARADALIARETAIDGRTHQVFAPHEAILDKTETTLNSVEQALNLMSNGGPPLSDAPNSAPVSPGEPTPSTDSPPAIWARLGP